MKFINSLIQSQQPQAGTTHKRTEPQYVRVKLLEPTIKKKSAKQLKKKRQILEILLGPRLWLPREERVTVFQPR